MRVVRPGHISRDKSPTLFEASVSSPVTNWIVLRVKQNDDVNGGRGWGAEYMIHWAISWSWVYLDVLFSHLNLSRIDIVNQLTQGLPIHILDFYLLGFTLRHVTYSSKQKQNEMNLVPRMCLTFTWSPTLSWQNKSTICAPGARRRNTQPQSRTYWRTSRSHQLWVWDHPQVQSQAFPNSVHCPFSFWRQIYTQESIQPSSCKLAHSGREKVNKIWTCPQGALGLLGQIY